MVVSVWLNGTRREAVVDFATQQDFVFVNEWGKSLGDAKNPVENDALLFARLAVSRFSVHSLEQDYAKSVKEIGDYTRNNPACEVPCLVVLKCDWFPESKVIGVCHFRRSWTNNIILDYLTVHPYAARKPPGYILSRTGEALAYFVSRVAQEYGCRLIWGETTPLSHEFYEHIFEIKRVGDLLHVSHKKFSGFLARLEQKWKQPDTVISAAEMVEQETRNQSNPLLGSKTAVLKPPHRLVNRFLDLAFDQQVTIMRSLALFQSGDEDQSQFELFRRVFQRASECGKVADLWAAVEKMHPDGNVSDNPFAPT